MKFKIMRNDILENQDLNSDEKIIMMLFEDRYKLSTKNKAMFNKNGEIFIIYSQDKLSKIIGKSRVTISKILKRLEKLGMIKRKSRFNASDIIFLPKFSKTLHTYAKKLNTNHTNNHTKTSDTNHTKMAKNKNVKQRSKTPEFSVDQLNSWKESVIGKACIDNNAVDTIIRYCRENGRYNLEKCKMIVGLIFKAKNMVAGQHGLDNNDKRTRFENNTNMDKLRITLENILLHARTARSEFSYIFSSLRNFFTSAMGFAPKNEQVTPTIRNNRRGHRDVKIPEWMKKKYDPSKDKVDPKLKKEAEMMLAKINNMSKVRKLEN